MNEFRHKKSLGQNFLHDDEILSKIANSINFTENDLVIEIGPGQGALTKHLKNKMSHLLCYEIDERTKKYLSLLEDKKTKILYNDFLKSNVINDIKNIAYEKLYVIANIPYYITTPIIEKVINDKLAVQEMTLLVQKEVAERFSAKPGSKIYGSISVYLQYYFEIKQLFTVSKFCFTPVPKVDSAVIHFKKHNKYKVMDETHFFNLIRAAFKQKRKNLRNNLYNYNLKIIEEILKKYNYDLTIRAEALSIDIFVELSNKLTSKI